ncbi:hypothetical protein BpHYR1_000323 [Brachionus plicatilis]|uniref:Uncharacterized protein n=1 Tax=Brachionus plicatilis TaxID=10195 RepID=A0A3M7R3R9_BRAPC|nr:hypothetical protein BpHYR1_000323 [Brachionus plicatilis]
MNKFYIEYECDFEGLKKLIQNSVHLRTTGLYLNFIFKKHSFQRFDLKVTSLITTWNERNESNKGKFTSIKANFPYVQIPLVLLRHYSFELQTNVKDTESGGSNQSEV